MVSRVEVDRLFVSGSRGVVFRVLSRLWWLVCGWLVMVGVVVGVGCFIEDFLVVVSRCWVVVDVVVSILLVK